jgi:D-alanine--poly(phosphoribitol) ligase subunit 2
MTGVTSKIQAMQVVIDALVVTLQGQGDDVPAAIGGDSKLFGASGLLDSIGLVSLVIEIEAQAESKLGSSLVLADDRAMSQRNSPFRTVATLSEFIVSLIGES